MERQHVSSGTDWEEQFGYSRAVRVGQQVHVSGTTATDEDGAVVAPGDPEAQTRRALEILEAALAEVGAGLEDVVRTRVFATDVDDWPAIGRAHSAAFGDGRPATSLVQVERLIDPDLVVEIEAEAVLEP